MSNTKGKVRGAATLLGIVLVLGIAERQISEQVAAQEGTPQAGKQVEQFAVDPTWPKALPNDWLVGSVIGVHVDSRDHVWILHRLATLSADETRAQWKKAPPVIEFDPAGNVVGSWGGPGQGYDWQRSEHGIYVDHKDNVWITGSHLQKFTRQGKLLLQIGKPDNKVTPPDDKLNFSQPSLAAVDPEANEVYVSDGYGNHHRVVVFDADTGVYKRHWGAYGKPPIDMPGNSREEASPTPEDLKTFGVVHCVEIAKDGLVYVCDRTRNRIQVFRKDGTFVEEVSTVKESISSGSAWDVAFSPDPQQQFMYVTDGQNDRIWQLTRKPLQVIAGFGTKGHWVGQFSGAHSIGVDSKGSVYVGETYEGKRIQRFVKNGMGPAKLPYPPPGTPTSGGGRPPRKGGGPGAAN